MSEIEGYACDRNGMLMPTRCRGSNGDECMCWPKVAQPAEAEGAGRCDAVKCLNCETIVSLEDHADADGACPVCMAELDLAGYLISANAALSAVTAERDRLRKENERLKRAAQTNWNEFADSVGERDQLRAEVAALRKDADRWNLYRQGFSNPEVMEANTDAQIKCLKRAAMAAKEAEPEHVCSGCGAKGWTGNCLECIPY